MIRYTFDFAEEPPFTFEMEDDDLFGKEDEAAAPEWLQLTHFRCPHCPILDERRHTCPAALAIRPVVKGFAKCISWETVQVTVNLNQLTTTACVPTQNAVRSLVGLLLARSACPVMARLRPMSHFHVPFGSSEHTSFRFLGMHFITQYLRKLDGEEPDWELEELLELLRSVRLVNRSLADRIRAATEGDATVNSLVILDALADAAELRVERNLTKLRSHFLPLPPDCL